MSNSNNTNLIQNIFNSQIEEAKHLLYILQKEYEALRTNNNEQFIAIVANKQSSADKMTQLENQLFNLLIDLGFPNNKQGIEKLISTARQQNQSNLVSTWDVLQKIAVKCQEQNQINGRVINMAKISTKTALDILHGHETNSTTYNQNGKTDDNDDGQSLAIA